MASEREKIEEWLKGPSGSWEHVRAGRIVRAALEIIDAEHAEAGHQPLDRTVQCWWCDRAEVHERKLWEAINGE